MIAPARPGVRLPMPMTRPALLNSPPHLPLIDPSLLAADWARLGEEARGVLDAGGDMLHIDVMDGHFAPNLAFGTEAVASLRRALPDAYLDVHLMVTDPAHFVPVFVEAGADHVSFHAEVLDEEGARALADEAHDLGVEVGLVINPPTPVEPWLDVMQAFDLLLVMSVNPGYAGQKFIPEVLKKVRTARDALGPGKRIQLDGGVGPANAQAVREAGGDVIVAANAIFGRPEAERAEVIRRLRGGASE